MSIFRKAKVAPSSGGNPQFFNGEAPAGSAGQMGFFAPYARPQMSETAPLYVPTDHPAVVTDGFDDCGMPDASIHYGYRTQPDVGGALNYAFENYQLPLQNVAGAFMVARTPFRPLGATPLQAWPTSVPTGLGLVPGQVISQPLLNPQGPENGFDIYS